MGINKKIGYSVLNILAVVILSVILSKLIIVPFSGIIGTSEETLSFVISVMFVFSMSVFAYISVTLLVNSLNISLSRRCSNVCIATPVIDFKNWKKILPPILLVSIVLLSTAPYANWLPQEITQSIRQVVTPGLIPYPVELLEGWRCRGMTVQQQNKRGYWADVETCVGKQICVHKPDIVECVTIACFTDKECNDLDKTTKDICINPGTEDALCINERGHMEE